ncbi:hypothetical protein E2562_037531 [Oryza meyeriana var. granulata]|uniref:Uncharacterized protein n=1 Tax=Oryza meyeriana var. granulata TaxID=110450 RepID=A0A6G1E881_9ORYZ|nr:hypothetical protein E2562_037531 [Oryza meyeriana var. granulata]
MEWKAQKRMLRLRLGLNLTKLYLGLELDTDLLPADGLVSASVVNACVQALRSLTAGPLLVVESPPRRGIAVAAPNDASGCPCSALDDSLSSGRATATGSEHNDNEDGARRLSGGTTNGDPAQGRSTTTIGLGGLGVGSQRTTTTEIGEAAECDEDSDPMRRLGD